MKKDNSLNQSDKAVNFWLCAGLLAILLTSILARDIDRPFYGLHSWAEAHGPWKARVHLKYGLGYTKGFMTNAVGNPPTKNATRYLDHPQLPSLLDAAVMAVLGVNTWSLRTANVAATIITLLLFLKILRGLLDDKTALLAGLFFCLFPLIGYFGVNMWLYPFALWVIWNYLVIIKAINTADESKKLHRIYLAFSLFMALQLNWEGFFFALAIGVHYVFRCISRKTFPDKSLLAILIIAPLSSMALDFVILAAGHGWDFQRIFELYKWRAGSGEMAEHNWGKWFARLWQHASTNFTLPVLFISIAYLTFGQLFVFTAPNEKGSFACPQRRFPQFWLFFMIPTFQLFILKGALWPHQTWIRPFSFLFAIAAAQAVMLLGDLLKKINKRAANAAMVAMVVVITISCIIGVNHYYYIRWQSPAKIKMLKMLNQKIPPDKYLLSFETFIVNQHKSKGAFYRPEIAWYLDREIVQARTFEEIQKYAQTDKYPYYLVPAVDSLPISTLIGQLRKRYKFQYVPGEAGERAKDGKFLRAGMMPYMIFDLSSRVFGF